MGYVTGWIISPRPDGASSRPCRAKPPPDPQVQEPPRGDGPPVGAARPPAALPSVRTRRLDRNRRVARSGRRPGSRRLDGRQPVRPPRHRFGWLPGRVKLARRTRTAGAPPRPPGPSDYRPRHWAIAVVLAIPRFPAPSRRHGPSDPGGGPRIARASASKSRPLYGSSRPKCSRRSGPPCGCGQATPNCIGGWCSRIKQLPVPEPCGAVPAATATTTGAAGSVRRSRRKRPRWARRTSGVLPALIAG